MRPPEGYTKAKQGQVCKLKRSIYGFKQASRECNVELSKFLKNFRMKQSKRDYCLFTKVQHAKTTMVLVYVDDLIITGDDEECIGVLKQELDKAFTIKDLWLMKYFLGIEVSRNAQGTMLNQRKYILDLVEDTGMIGCKTSKFPKLIPLICDNKVTHYIAQNPVFHDRTKHFKLDCHYVREQLEAGFISTLYINSSL